jgi:hypothetical protein
MSYFVYINFLTVMHCQNFSFYVGRMAGSLQDALLAFAITVVKQVADSTFKLEPGSVKMPNRTSTRGAAKK